MTALAFAGCSLSFAVKPGTRVTCSNDGECPARYRCAATKVCVEPGDQTPPKPLSAEPLDATTLRLHFSEEIALSDAVITTNYEITPPLEVTNAVREDATTVVLSTSSVTAGESYTVTVHDVRDLSANPTTAPDDNTTFVGFGQSPNANPPDLIAPLEEAAEFGDTVTLQWAARDGLRTYTLDVSLSSDFADILESATTQDTLHTFTPPNAGLRYYWRVRADTTRPDDYTVASFHVLADTIYVLCTTEPCVGGVGSRSAPLQSITAALTLAAQHQMPHVRVAARSAGAAYVESFALQAGVDIVGGFDPTFDIATQAASDTRTLVDTSTLGAVPVVSARGLHHDDPDATLSRFHLRANGATAALVVVDCDDAVSVDHSTIETTDAEAPTLAVLMQSNGTSLTEAPLLDTNIVHGGACTSATTREVSTGIIVRGGFARLTGNTITGGQALRHASFGVWVDAATGVTLSDNTIAGGDAVGAIFGSLLQRSVGVFAAASNGTLIMNNNTVTSGNVTSGRVHGLYIRGYVSTLTNNHITTGTKLTPSDFATAYGAFFDLTSPPRAIVATGNTFTVDPTANTREALFDSVYAQYTGNTFISNTRCADFLSGTTAPLFTLHDNVFVTCPTLVYIQPANTALTTDTQVNDFTAYGDGHTAGSVGGNTFAASVTHALP